MGALHGSLYHSLGMAGFHAGLSDRRVGMSLGSWQEWVVTIIVVYCVIRVGMSFYNTYKRGKEGDGVCAGCPTRESCKGNSKKTNKSCCE